VNEARRHGAQSRRALRLFERLSSEQRVLAGPSSQAPSTIPLEQALDRLSPRQRAVIDPHCYVDLSVREVAAVLGISEGTVKSTLSDARHRLRAIPGTGG
jgi:RNA polymerase sigma factor (sigma-70 family)